MLWDMQGGRYDGQPWPGYGKEIRIPVWEAEELVKARIAELADEPAKDRGYDVLRVPDQYFEDNLKLADGGVVEREEVFNADGPHRDPHATGLIEEDDFDSDFEDGDVDNEVEEITPQVKRPSTVDNKDAWIAYAVSKGADPVKAAAKTKKLLIAEY